MHLPHDAINRDGVLALFVNLIAKGYRYYFTGKIKAGKDPRSIDQRMLSHYGANLPKWTRERRKRAGKANFRYIRYGDTFFLLVSEGEAPDLWRDDRSRIRDLRVTPLRFSGYSISYRKGGNAKLSWDEKDARTRQWEAFKEARDAGRAATPPAPTKKDMRWHVRVQIDDDTYAGLKAFFLNMAVHREGGKIAAEFQSLNFQPYAPVRDQLRCILRAVNRERAIAGFDRIPLSVLPFTRRIVPAFAPAREDLWDSSDSNEASYVSKRVELNIPTCSEFQQQPIAPHAEAAYQRPEPLSGLERRDRLDSAEACSPDCEFLMLGG
jgi:hypothetical protein